MKSHDKFTRFSFILTSSNLTILEQIKNKLKTKNITSHLYLSAKAGRVSKWGIKTNKNVYNLTIYKKENVISLVSKLIHISQHEEKIWKMNLILESIDKKWDEIKDDLLKLKDSIKENTLSREVSTLQLNPRITEPPYLEPSKAD